MKDEGITVAEYFNSIGISAFVLWYRINPYRDPVPYLDCQRAIRYVKYHAAEYGIDPAQVGIMGFSAGGYVCGACVNRLRNAVVECEGYQPDEIDMVDDRPAFMILLYPVIHYYKSPNMLSVLAGDTVYDPSRREELMKEYDLILNVRPGDPPQFICYGEKDTLKGMHEYACKLKECGIVHKEVVMSGAGMVFQIRRNSDTGKRKWLYG